jgi:hypothetical protein
LGEEVECFSPLFVTGGSSQRGRIVVLATLPGMTKRKIKRAYLRGDIGLSDAIPDLMFDHCMDRGQAIRYLMESMRTNFS